AGGAVEQCGFVPGAKLGHAERRVMEAEVDNDVGARDHLFQAVADINFPNDLDIWKTRCARDQCLPHSSFGACDNNLDHAASFRTPQFSSVRCNISRYRPCIGTMGNRYSSLIIPRIARAAL